MWLKDWLSKGKYGPLDGNHSVEHKEFPLHSFLFKQIVSYLSKDLNKN